MKTKSIFFIYILLFTGCITSKVPYNSIINKKIMDKQYIEYSQCQYLFGPFTIGKTKMTKDDILQNTIIEAQEQGMNGDELINVNIEEDITTFILFSKLCLNINANLIYKK